MRQSFQFILCFSMSFLTYWSLKGQEHKICIDTNFVIATSLQIGDINLNVYDFKKNLSDGKWYYYRTKKCNQKNIDSFLEIEGEFLDSMRNGTFKYYYLIMPQKGNLRTLHILVKYSKGFLNGEFKIFSFNGTMLYEGFFINGRKDGFFIEYDPVKLNNSIKQIDFFIDDTLKYSAKYNEKGELMRK